MSAINQNQHAENTEPVTSFTERNNRTNETPRGVAGPSHNTAAQTALPAGQWLRVVMGFEAPFGHDGLPTVWG